MTPSTELRLPIELLSSIFELVLPQVLVALMRCNKRFYELCNPLLYKEVHVHTHTQLALLSGSQKAVEMIGTTQSLLIDDFALYLDLEAGDGDDIPDPFDHLVPVLRAATSLRSLKVAKGKMALRGSKRADWDEESGRSSELLRSAADDPEFLSKLTLLSVFNPAHPRTSCFNLIRRNRAIECYTIWNDTDVHVKISPALEAPRTMAPGYQLSPSTVSQGASSNYPQQYISGQEAGRLIRESVDASSCLNLNNLGFVIQLPGSAFDNELPPMRNIFPWLKDVLVTAEFPQLKFLEFHISSPSQVCIHDSTITLDAQRLGLEALQAIAPELQSMGISSTRTFWRRWAPTPGVTPSYPTIPQWTPCPTLNPQIGIRAMLMWWLDALGLNISGVQDRGVMKDFAKQLSVAMKERWESIYMDHYEATLYDQLLGQLQQ
jgi:hypothetical protein